MQNGTALHSTLPQNKSCYTFAVGPTVLTHLEVEDNRSLSLPVLPEVPLGTGGVRRFTDLVTSTLPIDIRVTPAAFS